MKKSTRLLSMLCGGAALLALISCGGNDSTGPGIRVDPGPIGGGGAPSDVFPSGNVVGTATSSLDAGPVANASVGIGSASTTSLSNGRWGINTGDAARALATVRAASYVDNIRAFAIAGLPVNVPSPLVPVAAATPITVATGG
ncbi:MAG: hypothetical protein MUC68_05675, partial [Burkholderiaceae bacterium]|nr:hypothetical protein [Burkholderiaceae bacterium]